MSKRKVEFAESSESGAALGSTDDGQSSEKSVRFKEKHSLDSDEEDLPDTGGQLDEDDIEGQEESTIDFDQGIQITPFNMREEMEEGHFDKEGTYIFKKEKEIHDGWIDNIDWVKIKEREKDYKEDDEDDDEPEEVDEIKTLREIVEFLKPGESILKGIRRLGGGGKTMSASQRWKAKKAGKAIQEAAGVDKEAMLNLTGLADHLLTAGHAEIYQETYEKIHFKIKKHDEEEEKKKTMIPEGTEDDDALDMFADSFDQKEPQQKSDIPSSSTEQTTETQTDSKSNTDTINEIMWQYKWKDEDSELHGPFTSQQMAEWSETGFFKDGVLVRKMSEGTDAQFYQSRRIDFELYT